MKRAFVTLVVALFATAVLAQTRVEIKPAELPGCCSEWIKTNMKDFTINKAFKNDNKGVITFYVNLITTKADVKGNKSQWFEFDKDCKNVKKVEDPKPEPAPQPKPKPQPKPAPAPTPAPTPKK